MAVFPAGKKRKGLYEAVHGPWRSVSLADSLGQISAEYAFIYPPGVPFLVPGEEITQEVLQWIRQAQEAGLNLMGLQDDTGKRIRICKM